MRGMRPTSHRAGPVLRHGVTLAELLVATTLLVVGVLALAGVSSQLVRAEAAARVESRAAALLAERFERAAAAACADTAGARRVRGVDERWRSSRAGGLLRVADTARYTLPALGARVAGIDGAVRCLP